MTTTPAAGRKAQHVTAPLRVLSLGWGVQSWTLAAMAAMGELPPIDVAIHADTTWERSDTYLFAKKWTPWLGEHGVTVQTVQAKNTEVVRTWRGKSVMIPAFTMETGKRGQVRRQCTRYWKVAPVKAAISAILRERGLPKRPGAVALLQGISLDEFQRMHDSPVAYLAHEYPLVDLRIKRTDCIQWLERHGLEVPPKSACVFCPFHSKTGWQDLGRRGGLDLAVATAIDQQVRNARPPVPLFVHPSMKPLNLAVVDDGQQSMWQDEAICDGGYCHS